MAIDLSRFSEETRRAIYETVVADCFAPRQLDEADADSTWVPPYTPDEAQLQVVFLFGRWLATWLKLEEKADAPEEERRELLRIDTDAADPGKLIYREV